MMDENQIDSIKKTKQFLGFLLLTLGLCLLLWVFTNVYSTFNDPGRLSAFQELVSSRVESTLSSDEGEKVKFVIPDEVLAYFIPIALLSVVVGVAGVLVRNGVRLLDSDLQLLIRRIDNLPYKINNKLASFMESAEKHLNKSSTDRDLER
jgi:flagellar biosynthesis protein FlhB